MTFRQGARTRTVTLALVLSLLLAGQAAAADWPMWRHDPHHSGASTQELAADLYLQWSRAHPPLKPGWPDQPKMQLDSAYDPVILGKTLFIASSRWDCVFALDTSSGDELWRFYTDGPVRYAPAAWQDRVFFTSDDGHLYCVDAARGTLRWKFRGAPADRRILGNERLVSTWPARGAPVVADGTVYFAASIWPFMGTFIHALDADTGKVLWTNDGDGSTWMKQPHQAEAFAGVAPQGPLALSGDRLLIPGGRSVPACYNRKTGKLMVYKLADTSKKGGGADVSVAAGFFFNGGAAFELATQKYLGEYGKQVALTEDRAYFHNKGKIRAYDLKLAAAKDVKEGKAKDAKGKATEPSIWTMTEVESCPAAGVDVLIKAGSRLYVGGEGFVAGIDLASLGRKGKGVVADEGGRDGGPAGRGR